MPMMIEASNTEVPWPPFWRYLVFVVFTIFPSITLVGIIQLKGAGITAYRAHFVLALTYGALLWMPVAILALFPGLWLFRRLNYVFSRLGLPTGIVAMALSALVFLFANLGIILHDLAGGTSFKAAMPLSILIQPYVVPAAALTGLLYLRPERRAG